MDLTAARARPAPPPIVCPEAERAVTCTRPIALTALMVVVATTTATATPACRSKKAGDGASSAAAGAALVPDGQPRARAPSDAAGAEPHAGAGPASSAPSGILERAKVSAVAYAAVDREREVLVAGAGLADRARGLAATGDTVFEAASVAKLIIAVCVMQLVEERRLSLDTPVSAHLGFAVRHPRFDDPITLRMLLAHRGAIRDRDDELTARAGADEDALAPFLERYLNDRGAPRGAAFFDTRPGAATRYSNVGAALAALVVERVTGEDFAEHSTRRVFEPLRMTATRWTAVPSPSAAQPYAFRGGTYFPLPPPSHAVYPAVDLHSTARDLARFARAVLRDGELDGARILTADSVRLMLRPVAGAADQALAWQLRTLDGSRVAGHEGEDAGASTALFLDREAGVGALFLANGDAFSSGDAVRASALQTLLVDLLARARH